ncbi:MAG: carbohydrate-binding family 9-like protein [Spirochaetota bacterium]
MTRTYVIERKSSLNLSVDPWRNVQEAKIDCFPWDNSGYRPASFAKMFCTADALHVLLRAAETPVRATYENLNDFVHRDSCLEFFLQPSPENDDRYINFEMNPLGTPHLGLGMERKGRTLLGEDDRLLLDIRAASPNELSGRGDRSSWEISFTIPFRFLERHYGPTDFSPGKRMRGNFYKCGDDTPQPHFGCWNPVEAKAPDFHRPEFFGELIMG